MACTARVWTLGTRWTTLTQNDWVLWFTWYSYAPVSKIPSESKNCYQKIDQGFWIYINRWRDLCRSAFSQLSLWIMLSSLSWRNKSRMHQRFVSSEANMNILLSHLIECRFFAYLYPKKYITKPKLVFFSLVQMLINFFVLVLSLNTWKNHLQNSPICTDN